jgi:hypothetical protein
VPTPLAVMKQHYGLAASWPAGTGRIDLGGRVIDVIPTPGTHKDGVSFYDPYCDFLFTGDLLFPGKINIGNDRDFLASLERLKAWTASHPVKWIMGGHIEMMFVPGKAYPVSPPTSPTSACWKWCRRCWTRQSSTRARSRARPDADPPGLHPAQQRQPGPAHAGMARRRAQHQSAPAVLKRPILFRQGRDPWIVARS